MRAAAAAQLQRQRPRGRRSLAGPAVLLLQLLMGVVVLLWVFVRL
jgi:hypothetical protein